MLRAKIASSSVEGQIKKETEPGQAPHFLESREEDQSQSVSIKPVLRVLRMVINLAPLTGGRRLMVFHRHVHFLNGNQISQEDHFIVFHTKIHQGELNWSSLALVSKITNHSSHISQTGQTKNTSKFRNEVQTNHIQNQNRNKMFHQRNIMIL